MVVVYVTGAVVAFTALAVCRSRWISPRSRQQAQSWARHAGHKLVRVERRSVFSSPFGVNGSLLQDVLYVTIEADGRFRHAWIRCGQKLLGAGRRSVEVRWAD